MPRVLLVAVLGLLALSPQAGAFRLHHAPRALAGNPADALANRPADPERYDPATHCTPRASRPGMRKLVAWLEQTQAGQDWGSYRCERWGPHSASLHAERRAEDWHLSVADPAQRAAARHLIVLLLAPDSAGTPHALARRMGIEEIIWDCSYWASGMAEFERYSACYSRRGRMLPHVDTTVAHRDHVHLGMTRAGAMGRTSFWCAAR